MNNTAAPGLRMRVVLPVVLIAAGLLAATVVMSHVGHSPIQKTPPAITEASPADPVPNPAQPISTSSSHRDIAAVAAIPGTTNAASSNAVAALAAKSEFSRAQKISELDDLMISDRPEQEVLGVMLTTLGSSDKAIRAAALEHIKELDDRDAVPQLQELADRAENEQDKAALQEAIDYLNLPSISDRSVAGRSSGRLVPKNSTWRDRRATHVPQNPSVKPAVVPGK